MQCKNAIYPLYHLKFLLCVLVWHLFYLCICVSPVVTKDKSKQKLTFNQITPACCPLVVACTTNMQFTFLFFFRLLRSFTLFLPTWRHLAVSLSFPFLVSLSLSQCVSMCVCVCLFVCPYDSFSVHVNVEPVFSLFLSPSPVTISE